MTSLTEIAHREARVGTGDIVIDATAGNGHDALFLARTVGPRGKVYAFDIQREALDRTAARLAEAGISHVQLVHGDHAHLRDLVEPQHHGEIAAVMFNLGYLPRGDKTIITRAASTIAAIQAAMRLLRDGGTITILAYPGHAGGEEELAAVERLVTESLPTVSVETFSGDEGIRISPRLLVLTKLEQMTG
ncbi:MAG TPA: class I SAM-dependent methyltransferase [Planctomycetaceae bacterium]|nr:class I SAM-dependent methyltransferase [Planctomycetaceae bacterium]